MTNIYGVKLDENSYAPSILNDTGDRCFVCEKGGDLARHEVFFGPYRERSKELGLWVNVCPFCHQMIHEQRTGIDKELKAIAQAQAMQHNKWSIADFRQRFGKNWLETDK